MKELDAEQFEDALRQATSEVKVVSAKLAGRSPSKLSPASPPKKAAAAGEVLASHPRAAGNPVTFGYLAKSTGAVSGKARSGQVREGMRGEVELGVEAGASIRKSKRTARSANGAPPLAVPELRPGASVADKSAQRGPTTWSSGGRRGCLAAPRLRDGSAGRAADARAAPVARGKPASVDQHSEDEDLGGEGSDDREEQWTESSAASNPLACSSTNHELAEPPPPSYATSMADEDMDDKDMEDSDGSGSEEHEESQLSEEQSLADASLEDEYDDNEGSIGPLETEESDDEMPALQK